MRQSINYPMILIIAFLIVCFTGPGVSAEDTAREKTARPVAEVSIGANGIGFSPVVEYGRLVLTVSGPGDSGFSKTFDSGTAPYFGVSESGKHLVDGAYTYELRVIPAAESKTRTSQQTKEGRSNKKTLTQTGYFRVLSGSIITPRAPSGGISTPQDILHLDDVIIDGSLCVGNDCYNGYAFGFDTIALLENNLRIFFDDTSTIQNYPRNDWRIICNDSTDGGGNYFAIEDATDVSNILVLEAGAPDNSIYVDSYGDVGINTSTPYYELHIVDGDSPAVRLEQDGSYGWEPQKWDVCGNESNFFIRDATHASKLPFRIEPEAPTDSIFIKSDGKVGLGTGSPGYALELETTGSAATFVCDQTDGATAMISAGGNYVFIGGKSNHDFRLLANDSPVMTLERGGDVGIGLTNPGYKLEITGGAYCDGGAWMPGSSREYKKNISNLTLAEATTALKDLNPVKFKYKESNTEEDYIGFIAEDVPPLVATKERKSVSPMDVVAVLTKVLQEQQKTIAELKKEVAELKKK